MESLFLDPNLERAAEEDDIIIFQSESLIVKSLSWAHTIAGKLNRFQRHDESDIRGILNYLTEQKGIVWNGDGNTVLRWLKEKLPYLAEDINSSEQLYLSRLQKRVFQVSR